MEKRIGTPQDSLPFPMPVKLPFTMGMPMLGGPISTAGNVLFIGATADNYLRAYNMSNGEKLWEARLPAGGQATPMTYEVNGKQYVVISAGGHGSFGTKMGDYIVAYALPDDANNAKRQRKLPFLVCRRSGDSDDLRSEWQTVCCHLCRRSRLVRYQNGRLYCRLRSRMTPITQNGNESRFGVPSFFPGWQQAET